MAAITDIIQNINTNNVPDDKHYLGPTLAVLALTDGPAELKADALHVMSAIAARRQCRMELVELGAIELLLLQLESSASLCGRRDAIEGLLKLAVDKRSHARFYLSKSISYILQYLRTSTAEERDEVAQVLTVLHCLLTTPLLRLQFLDQDGLSVMADLVISGTQEQTERAAFALWLLAAIPAVQPHFVATKAITALILSLEDGSSDLIDTALSALTLLAENEHCRAVLYSDDLRSMLPSLLRKEDRHEVRSRVELLDQILLP